MLHVRSTLSLMSKEWLMSVRKRALRRRVWFGVLSKIDRGVVELTIRYVDRVCSSRLALVIGRIVCKILNACRSHFLERVSMVGYDLVEKISKIAVGWGYAEASAWRQDLGFVKYLGVNIVNNSNGWDQV